MVLINPKGEICASMDVATQLPPWFRVPDGHMLSWRDVVVVGREVWDDLLPYRRLPRCGKATAIITTTSSTTGRIAAEIRVESPNPDDLFQ